MDVQLHKQNLQKGLEYFQNKCGPVAQVGGSTLVMQMCCSWN